MGKIFVTNENSTAHYERAASFGGAALAFVVAIILFSQQQDWSSGARLAAVNVSAVGAAGTGIYALVQLVKAHRKARAEKQE